MVVATHPAKAGFLRNEEKNLLKKAILFCAELLYPACVVIKKSIESIADVLYLSSLTAL